MERMAPNLFIPGAAKCGSSTLYSILGQHPDIHAPTMKEPTFFNWPHQFIGNPLAYFRMYDSQKRFRMDASVNYLANSQTPAVLRSLFPEARFVVTLRHPKARAYSLYRFMRRVGSESIPTFSEALKAEMSRYSSPEFSLTCMWDPWNYFYCKSSLYHEQLTCYFTVFPRAQFHIISLAELSKDPIGTTERILRFLGLDAAPAKNFRFEIQNRLEASYPPYDNESDGLMSLALDGVTDKTERLIDHAMDWSL